MSNWDRIEYLKETCQLCGKPDWCVRSDTAVICSRTEQCNLPTCRFCRSGKPRRAGNGGWLHITAVDRDLQPRRYFRSCRHRIADTERFQELHAQFTSDIQPSQFDWWAHRLGVSAESLRRLGCGWSVGYPVGLTIPLRNIRGDVVGIQVRAINHNKTSIRGSAVGAGLIVPSGLDPRRKLFLTEGASDCAALLTLGLQAVGRPSTGTSKDLVRRFVTTNGFRGLVVVADNDQHGAGQTAGAELARYLTHFAAEVRLLVPPTKDVRQWVAAGAKKTDIIEGIRNVA